MTLFCTGSAISLLIGALIAPEYLIIQDRMGGAVGNICDHIYRGKKEGKTNPNPNINTNPQLYPKLNPNLNFKPIPSTNSNLSPDPNPNLNPLP